MIKHTVIARAIFVACALVGCLRTASVAAANVGDPFGSEYRVNTTTGGYEIYPAVAMDAQGGYLIAWSSILPDHTQVIHAQRYAPDGTPVTPEFRVNPPGSSNGQPWVAMDPSGAYVVTWSASDGSSWGVFAQRYSSSDIPQGGPLLVPTVTANSQSAPRVAMDADGDFAITWMSLDAGSSGWRVWARLFAADGTPRGAAFRVDPANVTVHQTPSIAMDADGDFVIAWSGYDNGSNNGIWFRRYAADGAAQTARVLASAGNGPGWTWANPQVAADAAGNFIVVWDDEVSRFGETDRDVFASGYAASGSQVWSRRVNTVTLSSQDRPAVATSALGEAMVVWQDARQEAAGGSAVFDSGVFAQRLGLRDGNAVGGETHINTVTAGTQNYAAVARDADGDAVVTWVGWDQYGDPDIRAQRYTGGTVDLSITVGPSSESVTTDVPFEYVLRVSSGAIPGPATGFPVIDAALSSATSISVRDELPASVSYLGFEGDNWWCTPTGSIIDCAYDQPLVPSAVTTLVLRAQSSAPGLMSNTASLAMLQYDRSPSDNSVTTTTTSHDKRPDPIAFAGRVDVARSTEITSDPVVISGITAPVAVIAFGGSLSIDGGPFTESQQHASNGASIRLRHTSSASFSAAVSTTLRIEGAAAGTFSSTTAARDVVPDAFAFNSASNVARNALITSNSITPAGFNDGVSIAVDSGEYSIDGGPFTSATGVLLPGKSVTVRHVSSQAYLSSAKTTLSIGGVSGTFTSTTRQADTTPDAFTFIDQAAVAPGQNINSAPVTITGIEQPVPISVTNGYYSIDGTAFMNEPSLITAGQKVRVRHRSSSKFSTSVSTVLTVGGVSDTFTTTTVARDDTPDGFDFVDQAGIPGQPTDSNVVTVSGINTAVAIASSKAAIYVNGALIGGYGTVRNGDQVQLRAKVPLIPTASATTTVTIGNVADTWSVTSVIASPLE